MENKLVWNVKYEVSFRDNFKTPKYQMFLIYMFLYNSFTVVKNNSSDNSLSFHHVQYDAQNQAKKFI